MPPTNYSYDFATLPGELVDVRCTLSVSGGLLIAAAGGLTARGHGAYLDVGTDQQSVKVDVDPAGGGDGLMVRADASLDNGWRVRFEHDIVIQTTTTKQWKWVLTLRPAASKAPGKPAFDVHWGYAIERWGSRDEQPAVSSTGKVWDEHRHDGLGTHYHSVESARRTSEPPRTISNTTTTHRYWVRVDRMSAGVPLLKASEGPFTTQKIRGLWASADGRSRLRFGWVDATGTRRVSYEDNSLGFGRGNQGVGIVRAGPSQVTTTGLDNFVHTHLSAAPTAPIITAPVDGSTVDADDTDRPLILSWIPTSPDPGEESDGWAARVDVGSGYQYVDATSTPAAPTLSGSEVKNAGTVGAVDVGAMTEVDLTGVIANGVTDAQVSVKTWSADAVEGVYATDVVFSTSTAPTVAWVYPEDGGAVTDTSQPTFAVAVDDAESDVHDGTRFRLWARELVDDDPAGFDPDVTAPDVDSGWLGAVTTWQSPRLDNPSALVGMVKVRTDDGLESQWVRRDFEVDLAGPGTPTVEVEYDVASHRDVVAVQTTDNRLSTEDAGFEDGTGTWTATGATIAHVTDAPLDQIGALEATATADTDVALKVVDVPVAVGETIGAAGTVGDRGALITGAYIRATVRDAEGTSLGVFTGPTFEQVEATPVAPPSDVDYAVRWSRSPTRTQGEDLDGAIVAESDQLAVFLVDGDGNVVVTGDGITQVEWKINGVTHRVDTSPPYDFSGGSLSSAVLYPMSGRAGANTITAVVTRTDTTEQTITSTFQVSTTPFVSWRLNAGGPQLAGTPVWLDDTAYAAAGSSVQTRAAQVPAPSGIPAAAFNTERSWPAGVGGWENLPLSAGDHRIRFIAAEVFAGNHAVGRRVFDVLIDAGGGEERVIAGLDLYREVGTGAYVGEFTLEQPTMVTIRLRRTLATGGGPIGNAIEVLSPRLSPPHTVKAVPGVGEVRLEWTAHYAAAYEIRQDDVVVHTEADPTVKTWTATGLSAGVPHTWDVRSLGTEPLRDSDWSSAVTAAAADPGGGGGTDPSPSMFATAALLAVWRDRAVNGPYRTAGDVAPASPGDWTRIVGERATFLANPAGSLWEGPAGWRNIPNTGAIPEASAGGDAEWIDRSMPLLSAAFYALVKGDITTAQTARDIVVQQINYRDTKFGDTARWHPGIQGDNILLGFLGDWIAQHQGAWDYLRFAEQVYGWTLFTAAQVTAAKAWHGAFSTYILDSQDNLINPLFTDRVAGTPSGSGSSTPWSPLYDGGPNPWKAAGKFNNRNGRAMGGAAIGALIADNATLISRAKTWWQDAVRFSLYPQGAVADFHRGSGAQPHKGWKYALQGWAPGITFARALRNVKSDTSLLTFSSAGGVAGHNTGGTKTLQVGAAEFCKYTLGTYNRKINGVRIGAYRRIEDMALAEASWEWPTDTTIRDGVLRIGSPWAWPTNVDAGKTDPRRGTGFFPGVMFMFGGTP